MYIALCVLHLGFDHIIVLFSNVCPNFNNGHNKDFDSVPHRPLLQKLKSWVYIHIFLDGSHNTSAREVTMVPWSMSLYGDDLALYHPIYSTTDYHLLQNDMDKLCVWSDDNPMM